MSQRWLHLLHRFPLISSLQTSPPLFTPLLQPLLLYLVKMASFQKIHLFLYIIHSWEWKETTPTSSFATLLSINSLTLFLNLLNRYTYIMVYETILVYMSSFCMYMYCGCRRQKSLRPILWRNFPRKICLEIQLMKWLVFVLRYISITCLLIIEFELVYAFLWLSKEFQL